MVRESLIQALEQAAFTNDTTSDETSIPVKQPATQATKASARTIKTQVMTRPSFYQNVDNLNLFNVQSGPNPDQ